MNNKYKLPLIIFDSNCNLCCRFVKSLKILDSKNSLNFESLYHEDLYFEFDMINFEDCKKEVHLILNNENVLKGTEVVEYLILKIPGVKKISWLIVSEATKGAMDLFYRKLNSIRKKKQRCRTC